MPDQTQHARGDTLTPRPIVAGTRIGHVHLKVADLDRALAFYCGVLGFELMQRYGSEAAFISAGGYHHHIGLNTWESRGGAPPPPGTTGLFHLAILYPGRPALADALRRLIAAAFRSMVPPTTGSAKRSTCATRTKTASNCIATGRRPSGRARRTASSRCIREGSIWTTCCASRVLNDGLALAYDQSVLTTTALAFAIVSFSDLRRDALAIVAVCLVVASANRLADFDADLCRLDAFAIDIGPAAKARTRIAKQTCIAFNTRNATAHLSHADGICGDRKHELRDDQSEKSDEFRMLHRYLPLKA